MGFQSAVADTEIWLNPEVNPDGNKQEILWLYAMLCGRYYKFFNKGTWDYYEDKGNFNISNEKIGQPSNYLGTRL